MSDQQEDFVHDLLDAALRSYSSAEPRPGLEDRVLAGVRARKRVADRRWAMLGAIALVAAMATVVVLVTRRPRQASAPTPAAAKSIAPLPEPPITGTAPRRHLPIAHRPRQSTVRSKTDTRPPQFPTPRPLSEQEKLLLAYAEAVENSGAPPEAGAIPNLDHNLEIPPLRIAAITIEPLAPPDGAGEQN